MNCPPDKIMNPKTKRCVSRKGVIGRKILKGMNECPPDKIMNPKTKRCVSRKGVIGLKILLEMDNERRNKSIPKEPIRRNFFYNLREPTREQVREPKREQVREPMREPMRKSVRTPVRREQVRTPVRREQMRKSVREPTIRSKSISKEPIRRSKSISKEPIIRSKSISKEPIRRSKSISKEPIRRSKSISKEPIRRSKSTEWESVDTPVTWELERGDSDYYNSEGEEIKLKWENNSCYIDSLFVALFNKKTEFVEKEILRAPLIDYKNEKMRIIGEKIRQGLNEIYEGKKDRCTMIRRLMDEYYKELIKINPKIRIIDKRDNWTTTQNDPYDVYELLSKIFKIRDTTKIITGNNYPIYTNIINQISIDVLMKDKLRIEEIYPKYEITYNLDRANYYKDKDGKYQKTYTTRTEILKAPILIIKIGRNIGSEKIETKIIPKEKLKLRENERELKLNAIMIHYGNSKGGHYITLIKREGEWYEYDDMIGKKKRIGNIEDIIKEDKYTRNMIGLIYI